MKKTVFLFILCTFLFGISIKEIGSATNLDKLDFNDSLYIVSADKIPYVFKHKNIKIVGIDGYEKGILLTHKKKLNEVKTVANADLAVNIILKSVNRHYKNVKADLKDFLTKRVDAIYLPEYQGDYEKDLYVFHIDRFLFFPKKIIIGDVKYLNRHKKELYIFKKHLNVLFNALILTKYYYGSSIPMRNVVFFKTPKSKLVRVYVTPNWAPFDIYSNGRLKGIGIEFWKLIAKKARIDYIFIKDYSWNDILDKIKSQQADATPNTSVTKSRKKFAYFSKTYVSFPLGVVCKNKYRFENIKNIKTISVGKNFTAEKLMKKYYPGIKYIEAKNTVDALFKVEDNKAQCAVDILPSLMWYINRNSFNDLVLEFKTPFKFNLKVMVSKNNKMLLNKINRAIDSISENEKKNIISKYSSVILVEKKVNNLNIWLIMVFIAVIGGVFFILMRFKKKSETDEMTKILNRSATEKKLKEIIKKTDGGLLFLDLDRFKHINDTYGHEMGDYVLKEFSKIIKQNIRSTDVFGRWGGEEFVLVLPKTDYENTFKKAETIRKKIENHDFQSLKVTVSIGITSFKKGESVEDVIKRADDGVYKAKRGGRNRVIGKKD